MTHIEYEAFKEPAAQVRLLDVLPGRGLGTIWCQLRMVNLESVRGTYEPLSYCLGKETTFWKHLGVPILVNGVRVVVGENLCAALKRLHRKKGTRTLWVDALCINQGDIPEKNVQVQLMRDIYANGAQTLIWLGEQDYYTGRAFRVLEYLARHAEAHPNQAVETERWREYRRRDRGKKTAHPLRGLGFIWSAMPEGDTGRAMYSIFSREWFTRVWIIQEAVVSEKAIITCGSRAIAWDTLEQARSIMNGTLDEHHLLAILVDQRKKYRSSIAESLSSKVWLAARSKATDPRDKIYALLGLFTSEALGIPVVVDYNKCTGDVFREVTRQCLESSRDAGILAGSIGCRDQEGLGPMPSWAWRPMTTETDLSGLDFFSWTPEVKKRI